MKLYGYGALRPFLDMMIERITLIDKLFLLGMALLIMARLNAILGKVNGIKLLIFITICYLIAKVGEITNKKKKDNTSHESYSE